jgi:hypothetical protein
MASEFIAVKDAAGASQNVLVDTLSGGYVQVFKVGFGADDSAPTYASASAGLPVAQQGTWNIGTVTTVTTVAAVTAITNALPAGTNTIGAVTPKPTTSGGLTPYKLISAASTNGSSVKGSAGQVYVIYAVNTNAAVRYLKLYNKASAPTVGTDTPVLTLPIPGNTAGAGFLLNTGGIGIAFATGIALAITTGSADADTGAVAAGEVIVNLLYA